MTLVLLRETGLKSQRVHQQRKRTTEKDNGELQRPTAPSAIKLASQQTQNISMIFV